MVLFNYSTKELTAKIVYYGPGLCGKTTNLQFIYESLPGSINKGKMLSLATKTDRTLFFDFLPIDLGMIRGMRTRLQLYTVPGQVFYNTTRKLVLKGADGVVFVADSQKRMVDANLESLKNLEENLQEHGMNLSEMPLVLQFNKRDLPEALGLEDLNEKINRFNAPIYEAVATTGIGVHETLKAITRLVLNSLKEKYAERKELRPEPTAAVRAAMAARAVANAQAPASPETASPAAPIAAAAPPEPPAPATHAEVAFLAAPLREPAKPDMSVPEPSLYEIGASDAELELPELSLDAIPGSDPHVTVSAAPDGLEDVDLTLELAAEPEVPQGSLDDAEVLLELDEVVETSASTPASLGEWMDELPAASAIEDPLELPQIGSADSLDLTDEIPVPELPETLDLTAELSEPSSYDLEPGPALDGGDAGIDPFRDEASLSAEMDTTVDTGPSHSSESRPEQGTRAFEEDRSAMILDAVEGPPLGLARPEAESVVTEPGGAAAQEIAVPMNLTVGNQQIQFEIRISLDLVSGQPRLMGASANGRSSS